MDSPASSFEDLLDAAVPGAQRVTLWLAGHTLSATRLVSWSRQSGVLVCRGGSGFTDEDIHYIRVAHLHGLSLRVPAPRQESDRLGAEIRAALRAAAGYPISLAIRPNAFASAPVPLVAWCSQIVAAIAGLESQREALRSAVDQILLREGDVIAVLGGSTLILEANPDATPSAENIREAIARLL